MVDNIKILKRNILTTRDNLNILINSDLLNKIDKLSTLIHTSLRIRKSTYFVEMVDQQAKLHTLQLSLLAGTLKKEESNLLSLLQLIPQLLLQLVMIIVLKKFFLSK